MKRGQPLSRGDKPLARRVPLQQGEKGLSRGTPLTRATPMPRVGASPKPAAAKPRKPGVTTETRAVVLARCAGRCEACGKDLDRGGVDLHHRQRRRGGDHSPVNLVALHPACHTVAPEAVHQRPAWARERGLIVRSTDDPAVTPLVLPSGRRVLLDSAGSYLDVPLAA